MTAAACTGPSRDDRQGTGATPTRGGHLRLVVPGGGNVDLNPLTSTHDASFIGLLQLYEPLIRIRDGVIENVLAESAEPNADATAWTIRLRRGPAFHNGRQVTAADVAYSLRTLGDPRQSPNYAQFYSDVDRAHIKVRDARTVEVPLHRPRGDFREAILSLRSFVFPEGAKDWSKADGSGPFTLRSSGSGGVVLARNDHYWGPAPYLDSAAVSSVADPTARLDAVRGGQADYALDIPAAGARTVAHASTVEIRRGGKGNAVGRSFEMNLHADPFTSASVVLAMKLLVDRQQLVDNVLMGEGHVGNDMYGLGLPGYDSDLPQRHRDTDRAKSLLTAAGVSKLTVRAADLVPGVVDSAKLLAEQARDAGLHITVQQADADTYYVDFKKLLSTPVQGFYYVNAPIANLIGAYTGSRSAFNITGIDTHHYDTLLAAAQATVDDDARQAKFTQVQHYLWAHGGDLVWGFAEQLDAVRPGLGGVSLCQSRPLLGRVYLPGQP